MTVNAQESMYLLAQNTSEDGRGPYTNRCIAASLEEARAYIEMQPDPWNRSPDQLAWREGPGSTYYGTWLYTTLPLVDISDEDIAAQKDHLRKQALDKLTHTERTLLGLPDSESCYQD